MIVEERYIGAQRGLHVIAASRMVQFLRAFSSTITINYNGKTANCKSIISLLALEINENIKVRIATEGPDEEEEMKLFIDFLSSWGDDVDAEADIDIE